MYEVPGEQAWHVYGKLEEEDVWRLVDALPEKWGQVVRLWVDGYEHEEIGGIMGFAGNRSKKVLYMARKRLKEGLMEE